MAVRIIKQIKLDFLCYKYYVNVLKEQCVVLKKKLKLWIFTIHDINEVIIQSL